MPQTLRICAYALYQGLTKKDNKEGVSLDPFEDLRLQASANNLTLVAVRPDRKLAAGALDRPFTVVIAFSGITTFDIPVVAALELAD